MSFFKEDKNIVRVAKSCGIKGFMVVKLCQVVIDYSMNSKQMFINGIVQMPADLHYTRILSKPVFRSFHVPILVCGGHSDVSDAVEKHSADKRLRNAFIQVLGFTESTIQMIGLGQSSSVFNVSMEVNHMNASIP